jgi:hypothetical protein
MSNLNISSSEPRPRSFPRRVVLLIMLELDLAIGLFFVYRQRPDLPLLGMNVVSISLLGLAAGLATRIMLRERNWFIRFVSGSASLLIGLFSLGFLTHWLIGLGPLIFWRSEIDWIGLMKLSIGMLGLLLAMHAWRKQPVAVATIAPTSVVVEPSRPSVEPTPRQKRKTSKHAHFPVFSPKSTFKESPKSKVKSKQPVKPLIKPWLPLFSQKPKVHLSKTEKHLCPYCLDPVTRNDPRGIVECDICHTLHHGDCWAIAGACQVPHYTA